MALGPVSSAIYVQTTKENAGASQTRTPTAVTIHPAALFSILDHYLRRKDGQPRVIGTLLGTRTEHVVEVRSAFAVLHSETAELVAVDMEYHRTMFELHQKISPKEVILGWYSTGSELNTYSALVQNFYSQEAAPHQAIHVVMNTGIEDGQDVGVKAYVSSPVGVFPKPENCLFVPIPCELRFHDSERSGIDLLTAAASAQPSHTASSSTDLEILEKTLHDFSGMLDRVLAYVRSVLSGEREGNPAVGRYLMDTLGASTGVEDEERSGFNAKLQDTLMVSYLANLVRGQAEVSSRLALVQAV